MISQPSIPRLLESIRDELAEKIKPALSDPTLRVNVDMMMAVLNALVVRTEHEIDWMRAEADAIEAAAERLLPTLGDSAAADAALGAYRTRRGDSLVLSEVQADYDLASEVLSCLAEAAYAAGDAAAIAEVEQLFAHRLATENTAIGEFIAVGRD